MPEGVPKTDKGTDFNQTILTKLVSLLRLLTGVCAGVHLYETVVWIFLVHGPQYITLLGGVTLLEEIQSS